MIAVRIKHPSLRRARAAYERGFTGSDKICPYQNPRLGRVWSLGVEHRRALLRRRQTGAKR